MSGIVLPKGSVPFPRESIPWTDHLADVTSKDPIAHFLAQFRWDVLFEFDGEIGDAAARVEGAVREDAVRGASFDAAATCAALVCDERRVWLEHKVEQDLREQEV